MHYTYAMPITRPAQLLLGLSLLLVVSFVLIHPSSSLSVPYSDFWQSRPEYIPPAIFDSENRHLTTSQCQDRYPGLFHEADLARKFWQKKGGISLEDVDKADEDGGASARLAIINNKLYVKKFHGSVNTRTYAAMAAVWRTLLGSPEPMRDIDFVMQITDGGGGDEVHFVLDRKADQPHLWLMPDFGFFSWPEPGVGAYTEVRDKAKEFEKNLGLRFDVNGTVEESSWDKKEPKLMWRGVPMVDVRGELMRASENQPWSDVASLDWGKVNEDEAGRKAHNGDLKTPAEHCGYQFLAHVEGWAYSGRLKYLQQCRSVIVTHPLEWIQHYHHLMISDPNDPLQNVVEVKRPLEEHLPGMMDKLLDPANAEWVERIADNNWKYMREGYISPAANECYYRYALNAYASQQTFHPESGDGVAYESFLLMGRTHWDPHR